MNRRSLEAVWIVLACSLLSAPVLAQATPQTTPPINAKQIVLIRPGSSGVLPDEQTIRQLFGSWHWPEAITPQPPEGDEGYQVNFTKLESRHDDAILGIVTVSAYSEPQAVRRALHQAIDYLESALAEIGSALQESRQGDAEAFGKEVSGLESEIEALEAREVKLRSTGEFDEPAHWSAKLVDLRNETASLNARVGDARARLGLIHDQMVLAKKSAEDAAASGEQTLDALRTLVAMQQQEVRHALELVKKGSITESETNAAREQLLKAEIQLREKQQEMAQQAGAPVRQLSDQEQMISHELQSLEAQRQQVEGELNKLQSPDARASVIERQKLRRQIERARQRLTESEHRFEQLSNRLPDMRAPRVIRIEPKPNVH